MKKLKIIALVVLLALVVVTLAPDNTFAIWPLSFFFTASLLAHATALIGLYWYFTGSNGHGVTQQVIEVNLTTGEATMGSPVETYKDSVRGTYQYDMTDKDYSGGSSGNYGFCPPDLEHMGYLFVSGGDFNGCPSSRQFAARLTGDAGTCTVGGQTVNRQLTKVGCLPSEKAQPVIHAADNTLTPDATTTGAYDLTYDGNNYVVYPTAETIPPTEQPPTVTQNPSGGSTSVSNNSGGGTTSVTTNPDGSTSTVVKDANGNITSSTTTGPGGSTGSGSGGGSGSLVDALKDFFGGSGTGSGDAGNSGNTDMNGVSGDAGITGDLDSVTPDSITNRITGFLSSNPLVSVFSNSQVTASPGSCSFAASVWGHDISISFCDLDTTIDVLGSILLVVSTIYSFMIAWGRA